MVPNNSLDVCCCIIASLTADVGSLCSEWMDPHSVALTAAKLQKRLRAEGIGFLTKTLPRLRKSFDKALSGDVVLDCERFRKIPNTELPMLFGELFKQVFTDDGWVLPSPRIEVVRVIRQVFDLFYKYELPYEKDTEDAVVNDFVATENSMFEPADAPIQKCVNCSARSVGLEGNPPRPNVEYISARNSRRETNGNVVSGTCFTSGFDMHDGLCPSRYTTMFRLPYYPSRLGPIMDKSEPSWLGDSSANWKGVPISSGTVYSGLPPIKPSEASSSLVHDGRCWRGSTVRGDLQVAKALLRRVLCNFDPWDIVPRHGPGAVSTGEKQWEKMEFKRFFAQLDSVFSYADYFFVGTSHIVDEYATLQGLQDGLVPQAKVCLVPKDSRGPRLISCEPLEIQWIQQGLHRSLVSHIEHHPLTRGSVWFTDQTPNREAARKGSISGELATLDLKEASDRVSLALVKELFPEHLIPALMASRSEATRLPDGRLLKLKKFAPMGSALCFPVMALTIWAIIAARFIRRYGYTPSRVGDSILVFGDDVIVPTAQAADAIDALESVGLLVNRSKSFLTGHFKESCGLDAFYGEEVQPVRIKTVWTSYRSASSYASWIEYSNALFRRGYVRTARLIADWIIETYGPVRTCKEGNLGYPAFAFDTYASHLVEHRWNAELQRHQWRVWVIKPKRIRRGNYNGWSELLRYLSTTGTRESQASTPHQIRAFDCPLEIVDRKFEAGVYSPPKLSILSRRWR